MALRNHTPFAAELFRQFNLAGDLNGVVAVRGTFDVVAGGVLTLSKEQAPFQWSDEYEGDPHLTPLLIPADFIPFKPGTDITVLGTTYPPTGRAERCWECSVRVAGRLQKDFRIYGPRYWEPQFRNTSLLSGEGGVQVEGWRLTEPEPATCVPLSWRLAFGGPQPLCEGNQPPTQVHRDNGLGPGLLDRGLSPRDRWLPAPQIESPVEPIFDWQREYAPQGVAPIPPWWRCRQRHVGTIDDHWVKTRHPILPEDFDYRFYQCAHPDMIAEPWLNGNETIEFSHMHPEIPVLRLVLPRISLTARVKRDREAVDFNLVLDGVHADLREITSRVYLTWRAGFSCEIEAGNVHLFASLGGQVGGTAN